MQIVDRVEGFILDSFLFGDEARMPQRSDSLVQSGVIDSTGVLELIEFIEAEFGFQVDAAETVPDNLGSIDNIGAFVTAKLA